MLFDDQPSATFCASRRTLHDRDALLLVEVAKGNREALAELYCRTSAPLRSFAGRILIDPAETEDTIQEVFITVWNRAHLFDAARGTAFSWLTTVTRRRAIDRWRARARHSCIPRAYAMTHRMDLEDGSGCDQCLAFLGTLDFRTIRHAVEALPPEMRVAIEGVFFTGLSHAGIAARLGEPLGTVKARVRRGLLRLRLSLRVGGGQIAANRHDSPTGRAVSP